MTVTPDQLYLCISFMAGCGLAAFLGSLAWGTFKQHYPHLWWENREK